MYKEEYENKFEDFPLTLWSREDQYCKSFDEIIIFSWEGLISLALYIYASNKSGEIIVIMKSLATSINFEYFSFGSKKIILTSTLYSFTVNAEFKVERRRISFLEDITFVF